jgi:PAS domain S-box-containing protein
MAELRLLRTVLDSMGDALVVVDPAGRVVVANSLAREHIGEDTLEQPMRAWIDAFAFYREGEAEPDPADRFPLMRALRGQSVDAEEAYVVDRRNNQARWLSITAHPLLDDEGTVRGACTVYRDITRQRRAEEVMRLHNRAMESAHEGITISDPGKPGTPIIYANAGFEELTGYRSEEVVGRDWRFLQGDETDAAALDEIARAVQAGQSATVELRNYRKDGTPFWSRVSVTPVRDDTGRLTHYVGVHTDLTEVKQTEERLTRLAQELRAANQRMKNNLATAASIQQALLPHNLPEFPWGQVAWRYKPSEQLAGDILSVFQLDEDHIGAYVLDVCGHGVAAALLSVTVRRFMSPSFSPSSMVVGRGRLPGRLRIIGPAEVANSLNERFAWDANRGQFFTMFYAVLNIRTGEMRYVRAGHPPAVHLSAGRVEEVRGSGGYPIGITSDTYRETTVQLRPGDRVVLYSDGLTDVRDARRRVFGDERVMASLKASADLPLEQSLTELLHDTDKWRGRVPIPDDISVLGIEMGAD